MTGEKLATRFDASSSAILPGTRGEGCVERLLVELFFFLFMLASLFLLLFCFLQGRGWETFYLLAHQFQVSGLLELMAYREYRVFVPAEKMDEMGSVKPC